MEHHLPGLPATQGIKFNLFHVCVVLCFAFDQTGNDDDDMPGMNSVSAKVDVGGSTLEGAPTT
ncbi:unnamed protein product [Brassica oleracea]